MQANEIKFRCSQLGKLMTEPRSKSETISETTKSYLLEVYGQIKYGRKKEITSKYLEKGTIQEEEAITLYSKVTGDLFIKNEERLENDFITGTPDILTNPGVDTKCSWDLFTFLKSKYSPLNKDYYWQGLGYMWLTDVPLWKFAHCLVDTPDHLIASAKRSYLWNTNQIEDGNPVTTEALDEIEYNMRFGDIPEAERVHIIDVAYCHEDIERLKVRIQQFRDYMAKTFTF